MTSGRGSPAAQRRAQEALSARRRIAGWRAVKLWLCPEIAAAVAEQAAESGISFTAAAGAALERGLISHGQHTGA